MTLSVLGWVYFFCFALGLGYTFISLFLSHGHSHGGGLTGDLHAEASDAHDVFAKTVAHSHHPLGAHSKDVSLESGQPDFPLFSPLTIALSVTIFGGVGTMLSALKMPAYVSLPASGGAGVIGWLGAFYFFFKFFRFAQSSSEAVVEQLVGKEANVTLSIPSGGVGEISYVARGSRYNAPARSENGGPLRAGTHVVIVKIQESVYTVKESVEERLKRLDEGKETV